MANAFSASVGATRIVFCFYAQSAIHGALLDIVAFMRHIWRVMKITKQATDAAILTELGGRLTRVRLERNLT